MLLDLFKEKKGFKLVCGAGNEDATEVEKLVTLYSKAGCNYFDLCAKPEIVDAAKRGLERVGIKEDRYLCVSVGIASDPHISKAEINQDKCIKCGNCKENCPQNAILSNQNGYEINKIRCIGCRQCLKNCPSDCIEMHSKLMNMYEVLPPLLAKGIDAIELHVVGNDEEEVDEKWAAIQELFDGPLCISIERSKLGDDGILDRVSRMIKDREPYSTIIQADGISMSGGKDTYKATLQAVAIAEVFQNANMNAYLLLSGGTNSKTTELAKMCEIDVHGVAIGSFARKIVREYTDREDFFENEEVFNKALAIAKNLVDVTLEHMG